MYIQDDFTNDGFIEDDIDVAKILYTTMHADRHTEVKEVWSIKHINTTSRNIIIFLHDNTFLCTCLLLQHQGIICSHFFAVLIHSTTPQFHITLIPSRWYQNGVEDEALAQEEKVWNVGGEVETSTTPLLVSAYRGLSGKNVAADTLDQQTEIQMFGEVWGLCREAASLAVEFKDPTLKNLITNYVNDVKAKNRQDQLSNDDEIHNPVVSKPRGRPAKTRIASGGEQQAKKSNRRIRRPLVESTVSYNHVQDEMKSNGGMYT